MQRFPNLYLLLGRFAELFPVGQPPAKARDSELKKRDTWPKTNQQHWQVVLRQESAQRICMSSASQHNAGTLLKVIASRNVPGRIFYVLHYAERCALVEAGRFVKCI